MTKYALLKINMQLICSDHIKSSNIYNKTENLRHKSAHIFVTRLTYIIHIAYIVPLNIWQKKNQQHKHCNNNNRYHKI